MVNQNEDWIRVIEQLASQNMVNEQVLEELERALSMASDAVTPLAEGVQMTRESQVSLAAIASIALNQARTAVSTLRTKNSESNRLKQ